MPFSYEQVRQELHEEQIKLREQLERLGSVQYESIGYGNHMADDATDAYEQAVGVTMQRKVETTLEDVERALVKLGNGTYGLCESCGARIDRARLQALAYANCCLSCQSRKER